jgi:hypothetical protein
LLAQSAARRGKYHDAGDVQGPDQAGSLAVGPIRAMLPMVVQP